MRTKKFVFHPWVKTLFTAICTGIGYFAFWYAILLAGGGR